MVTGSIGLLFPGQGAQFPGMGKELFESDSTAACFLEEADSVLKFSLSRLILEGPEEELKKTAITQPAILTVSVAFADALKRRGIRAEVHAGHSLGEYSALVHAGAISFGDTVAAVHFRGTYMQEAVPEGVGAMSAVVGLDGGAVAEICRRSGESGVCAANFNAPTQTVISGTKEGVASATRLLKEHGARRVIPLRVSAPFHSPLMKPARERMEAILRNIQIRDAEVPVVVNVDASPLSGAEEIRDALIRQIDSPVRWVESVRRIEEMDIDRFIEVAPGRVLAGLVRKIAPEVPCFSVATPADIETILGGEE